MERVEGKGTSYEETVVYVVEVYYDERDNSILGWTEKEEVWGEDVDAVRQTLHWMLDATEKPVLNEEILLAQAAERGPLTEEEEFVSFDSIEELLANLEEDSDGTFTEDDQGNWHPVD
jgi:hypothetical protein